MEKPSTLNIKTLSGAYCDKDVILLHACFQLLTDFIEGEEAFTRHVDWEFDEAHKKAKDELEQLYHWWATRKTLDGINDLEKDQYEEDNEMLIRLIKVRQFMWT